MIPLKGFLRYCKMLLPFGVSSSGLTLLSIGKYDSGGVMLLIGFAFYVLFRREYIELIDFADDDLYWDKK